MYVYFLTAFGEDPLIKIGRSKNPQKRIVQLQSGSPFKLKMLGTVKCKSDEHARQVERLAHNIFYKQRRRGEWFRLSQRHTAQIKSLIEKVAEKQKPPEKVLSSAASRRATVVETLDFNEVIWDENTVWESL